MPHNSIANITTKRALMSFQEEGSTHKRLRTQAWTHDLYDSSDTHLRNCTACNSLNELHTFLIKCLDHSRPLFDFSRANKDVLGEVLDTVKRLSDQESINHGVSQTLHQIFDCLSEILKQYTDTVDEQISFKLFRLFRKMPTPKYIKAVRRQLERAERATFNESVSLVQWFHPLKDISSLYPAASDDVNKLYDTVSTLFTNTSFICSCDELLKLMAIIPSRNVENKATETFLCRTIQNTLNNERNVPLSFVSTFMDTQRHWKHTEQVDRVLGLLCQKSWTYVQVEPTHIRQICFGLINRSYTDNVDTLLEKTRSMSKLARNWTLSEIAECINNLKTMEFRRDKGQESYLCLIEDFTQQIKDTDTLISNRLVAKIMYGLSNQRLSSSVSKLVKAVSDKMDPDTPLTDQYLIHIFYGVRRLLFDTRFPIDFIEKISSKIDKHSMLQDESSVDLLQSLKEVTWHNASYSTLLNRITEKIDKTSILTPELFGKAIFSLKNSGGNHDASLELLSILRHKMPETLDLRYAELITVGLRGFSTDNEACVAIMEKLISAFERDSYKNNVQPVIDSLRGLKNKESRIVLSYLKEVKKYLDRISLSLDNTAKLLRCISEHQVSDKWVKRVLENIPNREGVDIHVGSVIRSLHKIAVYHPDLTSSTIYTNRYSRYQNRKHEVSETIYPSRIEKIIRRKLTEMSLDLQYNVIHSSGIEMDIFDPKTKINIELDGGNHRIPFIIEDNKRRDADLKNNYDITTIRIDYTQYSNDSDIYERVARDIVDIIGLSR